LHDAAGPPGGPVVARGPRGRRADGSQLDLWSLLPQALVVDASDRARSGIRIALREPAAAYRAAPPSVDCLCGLADDALIRTLQYAVVDVETTGGAWSRGHRVTEIAAVRVGGDGRVIDEFRSLVNPERPIPPFISALTNITWDMVADAPKFAEVADRVADVLRGAVFVAHNAAFDWGFVSRELERAGTNLTGQSLCTVRLARKVVPEVRSRSLDSLTYFFDIPVTQRHRAYGDAVATAELLRRLLERLDTMEVVRWAELSRLLRQRAPRRRRLANPQPMTEV
jgi:DNA polymerase III subunit epsilon